ncbi:MAG TPA: acyl-CoA dehydrogenase family protein [Blastocatellia bacterium]|nr:acyl-CoA dehydrogenase family protein [Blastocatellia bacterium]HMX24223.1 acyl-CoA dehydrogenase family protein [Blastocatellia bacterium]HMZ16604.1 acyl-CoA dehydrogenase family protein [Blastocatellia bacterium]HNG28203.1 acyl-CoA dehydrogenase family protein [Blastocatellia bacterium]
MSTPSRELVRQMQHADTTTVEQGRAALTAWEAAQPANFYETDQHLQNLLRMLWGEARLQTHAPRLSRFGGEAATIVDAAARRANLAENLPRLDRYSATGERTEDLLQSADHHLAGRYIYGSGVMAVYGQPESNLLALALFYLSSYNGEAGHNCPLACTAGVIKTLQHAGSETLKAKYLSQLLDADYDRRLHGAQFLTEVQGGSDVGANACTATLVDAAENKWRINGEKWFCSNASADVALMTARPEGSSGGTKGLGLFLIPRRLNDGTPNGIYLRRLKDKLGTKSMATAEMDFRDAVAYQVGGAGQGFQQAMDFVINTSRLYNAVGSAGAARRAYVIAWTYAQHRKAFGAPISAFPLVQEVLAEMRAETMAITSGSLYLAHLRDEIEAGRADETTKKFFRLVVNLNKYRSSISATDVIRRGIEVLGGNGAMENFSVLPRLLRDSVIFEAWEGAHGTLIAQSVRDCRRSKLHEAYFELLQQTLDSLADTDLKTRALASLEALRGELESLLTIDELAAAVCFRDLADRMMYLFYVARLAVEAAWEMANKQSLGKAAVIEWLMQNRVEKNAAKASANYLQQISEISSKL